MIHSFSGRKKFYIPAIIILGLSLPVFFEKAVMAAQTRGIGVVVKSAKGGKAQNIMLYDYTAALIIGIDRYANLGSRDQLSFALKDARGMEKVLRENYCFNEIVTLYNEDATRDKIMAALYRFREISPDAGLLVYFAGHGITMPGLRGGKDLGFLIPSDGSLNATEMYKNISMQQIKSDICPQINAKHIFFVFDACFAGLMLDTRATLTKPDRDLAYLKAITKEQARQVLTAGSKGQRVLDGGPRGHSVFTGRLIETLENTEDYITARELGQELKKQVYGDAAARGHNQRPVDGEIYGTGDFVFVFDLEKRSRDLKAEVGALEAEMQRLASLKKDAAKAKDDAMQRKLEREQLIKEAELKQARLRQKAGREEAGRKKELESQEKKDTQEKQQQARMREERIACLKRQTQEILKEFGGSTVSVLGIEGAQKEVRSIGSSIAKIEKDYQQALEEELWSLQLFYEKKFGRAGDIAPFDEMFETKSDYKTRRNKAEVKIKSLIAEKAQKEKAIKTHTDSELRKEVNPLQKQVEQITKKTFQVGSKDIDYKFIKYIPEIEAFNFSCTINDLYSTGLAYIPKAKARTYYNNPDLLIASAELMVADNGMVIPAQFKFRGPEGNSYKAKILRTVKDQYTGMEFLYVPGGCYEMGCGSWAGECYDDEKPVHTVCVDGFYIGRYEVTQGQWKKIMGSNPTKFKQCGNDCPVENISWNDAQAFIKQLNRKSGKKYRLPTEAEWEYAARSGGKKEKYAGGSGVNLLAWYKNNSGGHTYKAGTKAPNGLGLYDMSGNVWEWCQDLYGKDAYNQHQLKNPAYMSVGSDRVGRGGSWYGRARFCRSANRGGFSPSSRDKHLGFRLSRTF